MICKYSSFTLGLATEFMSKAEVKKYYTKKGHLGTSTVGT